MTKSPFSSGVTPNWEALVRCIRREGTPERVHHIELFLDPEVQTPSATAMVSWRVWPRRIPSSRRSARSSSSASWATTLFAAGWKA